MARKPMVTRTITTTIADVMCLDVVSAVPFNKKVTLPRTYKDDEALFKKVKEEIETDIFKPVYIVGKEEVETLYGMTEQDFISHAEVLPPRGTSETDTEIEE